MIDDKKHTIVLQSCPLCGGKAVMHTQRDEKRRENPTYVKCSCCGARIRTFSRVREAIAAWNRCAKEHKGLGNIVELTSIKQEMQQLLDQLNSQECGDEAETYTSGIAWVASGSSSFPRSMNGCARAARMKTK